MYDMFMDSLTGEVSLDDLEPCVEWNMLEKIRAGLKGVSDMGCTVKREETEDDSEVFFTLENKVYTGVLMPYRNLNDIPARYTITNNVGVKESMFFYSSYNDANIEEAAPKSFAEVMDLDLRELAKTPPPHP
jgi:hypothetical protein